VYMLYAAHYLFHLLIMWRRIVMSFCIVAVGYTDLLQIKVRLVIDNDLRTRWMCNSTARVCENLRIVIRLAFTVKVVVQLGLCCLLIK